MMEFDACQRRVLALDTERHARIVGAPGTGKTRLLIAAFLQALEQPGWGEEDALILAPNRLVSAALRRAVEQSSTRAFGGTPVRTAASLGFAVEARRAAIAGDPAPRLLTGTVHDEAIAAVVEAGLRDGAGTGFALVPEVLQSATFRAELRELWRVLDDFARDPDELASALRAAASNAASDVRTEAPAAELVDRWAESLSLVSAVDARLRRERPDERSASTLLAAAAASVRAEGQTGAGAQLRIPRLILVDDAQELGEGQLALLAACASVGTRIWVFGDPDLATGAFQGEPTRVLSGLVTELARRGGIDRSDAGAEQVITLETVHRHGAALRALVQDLTRRIGASGGAEHRGARASGGHRGSSVVQELDTGSTAASAASAASDASDASASDAASAASADSAVASAGVTAEVGSTATPAIRFATVTSPAEQLGAIAHHLRARRLGLDAAAPTRVTALQGAPDPRVVPSHGSREPSPMPDSRSIAWSDMAVVCRSRAEASRVARVLAVHQVPTGVAAGGIVLREHQIVRELIRVLQYALGLQSLDAPEVLKLAGGVMGGLDPVAVRRLRGALMMQERRDARAQEREPEATEHLVLAAFLSPGAEPAVDSAGGRALARLGTLAAAGRRVAEAGGTARETLWAIWEGTRLAGRWQDEALDGRGARSDEAHRSLDAVLGLFFALQRHEEQDREQPIEELLAELLASAVPEDSLAQRSRRDAVTVTTPQGMIGQEFAVVAVVGVQDGTWPNLRARGSLLGATALERWLRGGLAEAPSRRDTIHDELRLFVQACSRARNELLVVAVSDDDHHPSAFFRFGNAYRQDGLPSSRLTLRGATAEMRRALTSGVAATPPSEDARAARSLAALTHAGVPGAHPDEWYGVLPPSTDAPLVDLVGDPEARVPVSPSQLERAESCPLDWAISRLGGSGGSVQASLGTLVHHAMETAQTPDPLPMLDAIAREWSKLHFDAGWESERSFTTATAMVGGVAAYLREFEASDRQLVGSESRFEIPIGRAVLRGVADRLERRTATDGSPEVTVLDLKTGRSVPSANDTEQHAQLQAYQLGIVMNAFRTDTAGVPHTASAADDSTADRGSTADLAELPELPERAQPAELAESTLEPPADPLVEALTGAVSGGARLLYVHPDAAKKQPFVERAQSPISDDARAEFEARVADITAVMAAGRFTARIEHHCSDPFAPGDCRLHIIQAVSHP